MLAVGAGAATIAMTPELSFDPFNWVKLSVLVISATGASAIFLVSARTLLKSISIRLWLLFLAFILLTAVSALKNADLSENYWGTPGRATGALYIISIAIIFVLCSNISFDLLAKSVFKSLKITSTIFLSYVSIQFLDLDPIDWTVSQTFGFSGNLNFSSALLAIFATAELRFFFIAKVSWISKIMSSARIALSLFFVWYSGSLQGILMFVLALSLMFVIRIGPYLWANLRWSYAAVLSIFVFCIAAVISMSFKSFLNGIIFQETLGYRLDYWKAGLRMWSSSPFFGIGAGEFGVFYRKFRDSSAVFPDADRTSNSAHSILIELLAGQGVFVALLYFSTIIFVAVIGLKTSIVRGPSLYAVSYSLWMSLQVQLVLGISQASIGFWNSIFAGMLVAGARRLKVESKLPRNSGGKLNQHSFEKSRDRGTWEEVSMTPQATLSGILGFAFGFLLTCPILISDAQFQTFQKKGDISGMESVSRRSFVSVYYKERTLERFVQLNDYSQSRRLAEEILREHPNSFYAWKVMALLPDVDSAKRDEARERLQALDPANPAWEN
jgi:O-antigen ligase